MSIKVAALSDMHGNLAVKVPPCHVCLIAGDVCPWKRSDQPFDQIRWLINEFAAWTKDQPAARFLVTWGNHDWCGQKLPHLVPKIPNVEFLCDSGTRLTYWAGSQEPDEEYRCWGTPWQPPFYDWAFNLPEADLERKWALIPDKTDILVCHGPPRGFGDLVERHHDEPLQEHEEETIGGVLVGSVSLLKRIQRVKPKLVVFGHIHPGRGQWKLVHEDGSRTILANVSVLDDQYRLAHEPMEFELW